MLQTHVPQLYAEARRVETNLRGDPRSACFYAGAKRALCGCVTTASKQAFGAFLSDSNCGSAHIDFINQVIDLLAQNGRVEPKQLFDQRFTIAHPAGLFLWA